MSRFYPLSLFLFPHLGLHTRSARLAPGIELEMRSHDFILTLLCTATIVIAQTLTLTIPNGCVELFLHLFASLKNWMFPEGLQLFKYLRQMLKVFRLD